MDGVFLAPRVCVFQDCLAMNNFFPQEKSDMTQQLCDYCHYETVY